MDRWRGTGGVIRLMSLGVFRLAIQDVARLNATAHSKSLPLSDSYSEEEIDDLQHVVNMVMRKMMAEVTWQLSSLFSRA